MEQKMMMPLVKENISNLDVAEFNLILKGNISSLGCRDLASPEILYPYGTRNSQMTMVVVIYCILLLIGVCGNSSVLSVVLYMRKILKKQRATDKENIFIFFIALCTVDSMLILSMPMAITYFLLSHWLFGTFLCRFYWLMESVGKIMSTFVLVCWAFERYMVVCHPTKFIRFPWSRILGVLALFVLVLLAPLPYSAEVSAIPMKIPTSAFSGMSFYVLKCSTSGMSDILFTAFTLYIFILGYCIPLALMLFFYSRILLQTRWQKQALKQSKIPLKRVTSYSIALVSFYFLCYTPYWVGVLHSLFVNNFVTTNSRLYIMYAIHGLPYVNSSFNFVFYALLNSQLRNKNQEIVTTLSRSALSSAAYSSEYPKINVDGKVVNKAPDEVGYTLLRPRSSTLSPDGRSSRNFTSTLTPIDGKVMEKANVTIKMCENLNDCVQL